MIRRLQRMTLVALLTVLVGAGAAMASGWQYSAVGARAKAMGGACRATADDWSGAYYNPAGLAYMEANVWNLTAETISPRPEVQPNFKLNGYDLGYLDGQTRYPNDDKPLLWGAGSLFARPSATSPLVLGLAVYQSFDQNADMSLFYLRDSYNDFIDMSESNHNSNFDVVVFHPAIAYRFSGDRFSVGVGVPIYRGDIRLDQVRLVTNPYDYVLNVRPYEFFPKLFTVDGYGYGVGANAGVQFRPSEKLSLGASYTSSVSISLDGESSEEVFLPHNQGIVNLYNDDKATESEIEIRQTYSGGSFVAQSEFDLDMKLPSQFGLGLALQASEKWLLAADFSYTLWSEFDDFDIRLSNKQFDRSVYDTWASLLSDFYVPMGWDDAFRFGAGAEGVISERWTIRLGYSFDQSPIPDETFSELFMDTGDKHHFALGAKFMLNEAVSFEGAVEAVLYGERTIDQIVDVNNDGYFDNFGGTFKNRAFTSTWAFNYSF